MMLVRALVWLGVLGWSFAVIDFGVSFLLRAFTRKGRQLGGIRLRFTWAGAAFGTVCYLLSRLGHLPPFALRASLDVGLALAGVVCGAALAFTFIRRGSGVLR